MQAYSDPKRSTDPHALPDVEVFQGSDYTLEGGGNRMSTTDLIMEWLAGDASTAGVERVARYMSRTLRIGGLRNCRILVLTALEDAAGKTCDHGPQASCPREVAQAALREVNAR